MSIRESTKKGGFLTPRIADDPSEAFRSPRRDSYRDECRMTSQVTVRSLFLILGFAGLATAQEPPPLEPPDLEPPRTSAPQPQPASPPKPTNPKPATPPTSQAGGHEPEGSPSSRSSRGPGNAAAPVRPEAGPMLAIPGITAPTARPQRSSRLPAAVPPAAGIPLALPSFSMRPLAFPGTPTRPPTRSAGIPPPGAAGTLVARADPDDDRAAPR